MDKQTGSLCPRCGLKTLNVFYEDMGDMQIGATCDSCGFKGFFMNENLLPLVTA
jgi:hypothetical protein